VKHSFRSKANFVQHNRDIDNFYRDRNEIENNFQNFAFSKDGKITDNLRYQVSSFFTKDDFGFLSHSGLTMAGTREERYGGKGIIQYSPFSGNSLAVGTEFRKYDMGRKNADGNNFIVNKAEPDSFFGKESVNAFQVNRTNQFVFNRSIEVASIFAEDVQKLSDKWEVFGAFRFDKHPFWGQNISPRIGTIFSPTNQWRWRTSYQEGFRGAVGVAYTGGYQRDGLLRTENFDEIVFANIPNKDQNGNPTVFQNIQPTKPEKMRSFELASSFKAKKDWNINGVVFYNMIESVIDVGVIYPNPDDRSAPRIGSDQPGDWKGYFFWRNTPGILRQGGGEISFEYKWKNLIYSNSYSIVRVVNASKVLHSSQYLTSDTRHRHFRAFPEEIEIIFNTKLPRN